MPRKGVVERERGPGERRRERRAEKIENETIEKTPKEDFRKKIDGRGAKTCPLSFFSRDIKAAKWDFGSIIAPRGEAKKGSTFHFSKAFWIMRVT